MHNRTACSWSWFFSKKWQNIKILKTLDFFHNQSQSLSHFCSIFWISSYYTKEIPYWHMKKHKKSTKTLPLAVKKIKSFQYFSILSIFNEKSCSGARGPNCDSFRESNPTMLEFCVSFFCFCFFARLWTT